MVLRIPDHSKMTWPHAYDALTKYFVFYNGERTHQALGNQTWQAVHASWTGGDAMNVDKYGAMQKLPIALCCTASAFAEVRTENESETQNAKNRGSAV